MSKPATSVYVSIVDLQDKTSKHKVIIHKKFFRKNDANAFVKENLEAYPKPQYQIITETY